MSTYTYLLFHNSQSYDTSLTYASRLAILSKKDILAAGERIGLKLPASNTKEMLAEKLADYVLAHPKEMVTMLEDDEVVLAHDIIEAGENAITWRPHRLRYHTLKQMVWVMVNRDKQKRKDGFVMLDELQKTFTPFVAERYNFSLKMVQAAKSQKKPATSRLYLKDLPAKLAGLDLEQLKIVHYLFQNNYMEEDAASDWCDVWICEAYHENAYDWFKSGGEEDSSILNHLVYEILGEWKEHKSSLYRRAMNDIKDWISFDFTSFESTHAEDVKKAFEEAMSSGDDKTVVKALMPYLKLAKEYAAEKKYLDAIALSFCLFDNLGKAYQQHQEWFDCIWNGGVQTRIATFLEVLRYFYCHLRQIDSLSFRIKEDMDIHLIITNRHHDLFGDIEISWCDSRMNDMLSDGKDQYNDYSDPDDTLYDYLEK